MRRALILGLAALTCPGLPAADQKALTAAGRVVVLKEDGTWAYASPTKADAGAPLVYRGRHGTFSLTLPAGKWVRSRGAAPPLEAVFTHADGDVVIMVLAERIAVPMKALQRAATAQVLTKGTDARIVAENARSVGGAEVLDLTVETTLQDIPFTYLFRLHTGDEGAVQVIAYTGRNLFKRYKADMEAALAGFRVVKPADAGRDPAPPAGRPSDAELAKLLVGRWQQDRRNGADRFEATDTFAADGTFKGEGTMTRGGEAQTVRVTGTWAVRDGVLVETIETCVPPILTKGQVSKDALLSATAKEVRIRTESGGEYVMTRVPE